MTVSGLVLSIGEASTERAIESLENQTFSCSDIVVVENVVPFHRAMNEGVSRIKTDFFIQCDADMVLDADCVETLLNFMDTNVGVSIGYLSDPIRGKVQAVKMFRTCHVRNLKFTDHVSPDTDYIERLKSMGVEYVFAARPKPCYGHEPDVFGEHLPDYTPMYTFQKFRLEGSRIAARGSYEELELTLKRLAQSTHPMANIAIIGLCRGVFELRSDDGLSPFLSDPEFKKLERLLENPRSADYSFNPVVF